MHIDALLLDRFYGLQGKFINIGELANHQFGGRQTNGTPKWRKLENHPPSHDYGAAGE
jgi:hypothetical protein